MVYFIDLDAQGVNPAFEEEASEQVSKSLDKVVKGDIPKIEFPEAQLKYLSVLARKFNSSNSVDIPGELQRLKQISDYFANRETYNRYFPENIGYLDSIETRLKEIDGRPLPQRLSELCSILLERFKNGITPAGNNLK